MKNLKLDFNWDLASAPSSPACYIDPALGYLFAASCCEIRT